MPNDHLATYLNDHLAGATAGLELVEHLQKTQAGTPIGQFAAGLHADILADKRELESLIARLNIPASLPRKASAWLAEKAAQLKLKVDDPAGGPLRLLESLEALSLGIEGKRLLWWALEVAGVPGMSEADFKRLQLRAEEQRDRVETLRLEAARAALGAF